MPTPTAVSLENANIRASRVTSVDGLRGLLLDARHQPKSAVDPAIGRLVEAQTRLDRKPGVAQPAALGIGGNAAALG